MEDGLTRQLKAIDRHNAQVRESADRSARHNIIEGTKDAVKYDFRKATGFIINGLKKPKEKLSTKIWRLQNKLEARYKLVNVIFSFIRRTKQKINHLSYKKPKGGYYEHRRY